MIQFLAISLASALSIITLYKFFNEFLGEITFRLDRVLPAYIQKPLYGCLFCMSSFWGFVFLLLFSNQFHVDMNIIKFFLGWLTVAGALIVFVALIETLDFILTLAETKL